MTNMFMRRTRAGLTGLALGAVLLALGAARASAQTPCPSGVTGAIGGILNETMESPPAHAGPGGPLLAGVFPAGQNVRIAQATERGIFGNGCGTLEGFAGQVTVQAQSRIPFFGIDPTTQLPIFGSGPITGSFKVETAAKVINGKLDGTLSFTPGSPIVPAFGSWSTNGKGGTSGLFTGVALVPFEFPSVGWVYADPTTQLPGGVLTGFCLAGDPVTGQCLLLVNIVPVGPDDLNKQHGTPEAKFIIQMYQ